MEENLTPVQQEQEQQPEVAKKSVIEENEKWFSFYEKLPTILVWVISVIFFIAGIVLARYEGAIIIACWAGGALIAWITYALTKIAFSYKILVVKYLKKISEKE